MDDFLGTKVALYFGNKLIVYLRDNKPGLEFANMWDFPGGGRENNETPFECLKREVDEEFGIKLEKSAVLWEKIYPAMRDPNLKGIFFVAKISEELFNQIKFGDEGQRWQLMTVEEFLSNPDSVPHLKTRLQDYLNTLNV